MRWFELARVPDAMRHYYADPPELSPFVIREFYLSGPTPSLRICGTLSRPPDSYATDPTATASIWLVFWNVADCAISGCPIGGNTDLRISRDEASLIDVAYTGDRINFRATCKSFEIELVDVYSEEFVKQNRRTLFAYPDIWNSCLIILRRLGFDLELAGDPDPDGFATHCRWHAIRDKTVLKAANPIELLGLAKIEETRGEISDDPYWWREEGPDLVTELSDAWSLKWHDDKSHGRKP